MVGGYKEKVSETVRVGDLGVNGVLLLSSLGRFHPGSHRGFHGVTKTHFFTE